MRAREGVMHSEYFGNDLQKLFPIIEEGGSDSSAFDNVLELLVVNGVLSLPEAIMMMLPEAWQSNTNMETEKKAWYEWAACLMEAYDGPGKEYNRYRYSPSLLCEKQNVAETYIHCVGETI
jgi:glutamate synthase (NADPH/NADH)